MTRIILLRHGQSVINATQQTQSVFCGQFDTPLTEPGRQQAQSAGRQLSDRRLYRISHVVSSQLPRAVETLQLVLQWLSPAPTRLAGHAGFNERSLGIFEGRSEQEVFEEYPQYRDDPELRNFRADFQQRAPGGENLREVQQRTMRALTEILPFVSEDLLIVAHCQSIRCLIAGLTGCDEATALQLHVPNAEPLLLELTPAGCWKQADAA
jgi:broad specificity phosphatase PhoE